MSDLHLAFLGPPEVRHDRQVLAFRTCKVMALLVYLAVEGSLRSREKLTALLWPESDAPQGRMLLRRTLLLLRQGLHEDTESPGLNHIIVERDMLGCNFTSGIHLDLQTVQKAAQASRKQSSHLPRNAPQSDESRAVVAQLQAAVAVYRGNFLDSFYLDDAPDFDDWMRLQRHAWHTRINLIFDRLSLLQSHGGDFADAIETATRWLTHEPLNETVYLRLMQLYLMMGNRDAALRTYEACQTMLARELRAKPAPETEALYERIRMTAGISSPSPVPRSPAHQASPLSPSSMLVEGPLVGRTNEFTVLVERFHLAKQGSTQVVLLKGEAGIGKTRLANEFLRWATAQGATVLQGRAFETGGRLTYQPLVESLRSRIERENAPDDLLSDTWLAELGRLLPELRDRYPDLPVAEGDEATARSRLFEAVARLGQALAERAPVVLFIDDVQWADAASLDLLHYLGRCWIERGTPLMLLMSIRAEALINPGMIAQWLAGLVHDLSMAYLHLSALQLEDILRLVQALGKGENGQEIKELTQFAQWLCTETGGQPFYIIEMLKALLEREVLVSYRKADGSWREAENLAREASALYRKLGNRPMESDCLCQVAMACTCDGRYQAGLDVGQEALATSLEIENYWGQVDCNCQLAMGSLEAGVYSEALSYAQQAVTLSRTLGVSILLNASLTILGRVLRTMMDLDAALAAHLEIIEVTKALFAHTVEMTAAELCVNYALSEQWDEAHTYAIQALDNRLNSPYLYMGLTRWYETEALMRAGEIERAVEDVQRCGTYFGKSKRHRIPYLRSLAVLAHYRGEIDLAIIHLHEAAKLAEEIGLPGELWLIQATLGDLYLKQGEDEQSRNVYREAARLVNKLAVDVRENERRKTYLSSPLIQRVLQAAASKGG